MNFVFKILSKKRKLKRKGILKKKLERACKPRAPSAQGRGLACPRPAYAGCACADDLEMDGPGPLLPLRCLKKNRGKQREGEEDDDVVDRRRGTAIPANRGFAWMLRWPEVVQWTEANLSS